MVPQIPKLSSAQLQSLWGLMARVLGWPFSPMESLLYQEDEDISISKCLGTTVSEVLPADRAANSPNDLWGIHWRPLKTSSTLCLSHTHRLQLLNSHFEHLCNISMGLQSLHNHQSLLCGIKMKCHLFTKAEKILPNFYFKIKLLAWLTDMFIHLFPTKAL